MKKEFEEVHALYEKFLGTLRANLEQLEGASGNTSLSSNGSSQILNGNVSGNADGGSQNSSFNTQIGEEPQKKTEVQKHRTEYGLAWIMYMRFGMRAEGVKPSRTIFAKARKDRWTPWEVYEAAGLSFFLCLFGFLIAFGLALMEYHCSDGKVVASRIFERGLDVFGDEIEYVVRYLGFLISINDENSTSLFHSQRSLTNCDVISDARALFERVIPNFPPERARPLWERWARYEYQYGDLEASLKLEKRMADVYSSGTCPFLGVTFGSSQH